MSKKNEPITLDEVMGCSALRSIIMQAVIGGKCSESADIDKVASNLMKNEGMQAYIHRLGYQIQNTLRDREPKTDPFGF